MERIEFCWRQKNFSRFKKFGFPACLGKKKTTNPKQNQTKQNKPKPANYLIFLLKAVISICYRNLKFFSTFFLWLCTRDCSQGALCHFIFWLFAILPFPSSFLLISFPLQLSCYFFYLSHPSYFYKPSPKLFVNKSFIK